MLTPHLSCLTDGFLASPWPPWLQLNVPDHNFECVHVCACVRAYVCVCVRAPFDPKSTRSLSLYTMLWIKHIACNDIKGTRKSTRTAIILHTDCHCTSLPAPGVPYWGERGGKGKGCLSGAVRNCVRVHVCSERCLGLGTVGPPCKGRDHLRIRICKREKKTERGTTGVRKPMSMAAG